MQSLGVGMGQTTTACSYAERLGRKPESIKSPFQSLLMYLELAMKRPTS